MRAGLRLRVVVRAPLQFPGREAPDVHVVFVQTGVVAIVGELDLELHLAGSHGQSAHRTRRPHARAAPRAVGPAAGKLAISNDGTRLLAEGVLVHLDDLDACTSPRNEKRVKPDASGSGARRVCRRPNGRRSKSTIEAPRGRAPPGRWRSA